MPLHAPFPFFRTKSAIITENPSGNLEEKPYLSPKNWGLQSSRLCLTFEGKPNGIL